MNFFISFLKKSVLIFMGINHLIANEPSILNYVKPIELTEPYSGLDLVDIIYLINLDRRGDRLEIMKQALDENGLFANRVSAFDGTFISGQIIQKCLGPYLGQSFLQSHINRPIGGMMGCLLSHLAIIKDAHQRALNTILVLEDDVQIIRNIHYIPLFLADLTELDPLWDICYLDQGHVSHPILKAPPDRDIPPHLVFHENRKEQVGIFQRVYWRYGTYAMVISQSGIKKIIDYYKTFYVFGPIDNDLHWIPEIRQYEVPFEMIIPRFDLGSDIGLEAKFILPQ